MGRCGLSEAAECIRLELFSCSPDIQFDKVTFDELAKAFLQDYRINNKKSYIRAERSVGHLTRFFEGYNVPNIAPSVIN